MGTPRAYLRPVLEQAYSKPYVVLTTPELDNHKRSTKPMVEYVLGTHLTPAQQEHAKRRFVHRYTKEHKPAWAHKPMSNGEAYKPQFADDAQWLAHTKFPIRKDGAFANRPGHCISAPTWPEG